MINQTKLKESIKLIKDVIERNNQAEIEEVYGNMYSLYKPELGDINLLPLSDGATKFMNAAYGQNKHVERYPDNYKKNLIRIKDKLELLIDDSPFKEAAPSINISIKNNNENLNENNISMTIDITFEDVKNEIDKMDEKLSAKEIQEIKNKIDEMQQIIESKDRKTSKWNKLGSILRWLADKSVDVGIALLPLILKINN